MLLTDNFRLIALNGGAGPDAFSAIEDEFLAAYRLLCESKKLTCIETGITYEGIPAPKLIIIDVRPICI